MQILIVEDEPLIALSLAEELTRAGHSVIGPVGTSAEAMRLADTERPDLALVDIDLERKLAGISVARHLTLDLHIPSIYVTGQRAAAQRHADTALGVITKPFQLSDITKALDVAEKIIRGGTPPPPQVPGAMQLF